MNRYRAIVLWIEGGEQDAAKVEFKADNDEAAAEWVDAMIADKWGGWFSITLNRLVATDIVGEVEKWIGLQIKTDE
jgi:hypothetical protein